MLVSQLGDVASDTWPSTGEIDTETNSLALSIHQFAQDAFDQGLPGWNDQGMQTAWNTFVADFDQWKDTGYFWNPGRRDELLDYRARFNDLMAMAKQGGVQSNVSARQVGATTPGKDALDKLSDILTKGSYIVIGIGVLWAAATVYKEVRGR